MHYIELKESLKDFTLFSIKDINKIDSRFYRSRLNEWQDKGYIRKVIKGYYIFSDLKLNENVLFEIANRIYNPSYVSFEMAFSYYHLIPGSVYEITSASTRRTYKFTTSIAEFKYRTISSRLFFGYNLVNYDNKYFKFASVEKAILDYFYINSHLNENDDFASLRINKNIFFEQIDEQKMYSYLDKFSKKSLTHRIKSFWKYLKHA